MAAKTGISWCDSTFNPWIGCTRISPGCDGCYAARSTPARAMGIVWGAGQERRRTSVSNWSLPTRWNRQHDAFFAEHGRRRRVFCASLADVFDNQVPAAWRADLFQLIQDTPQLDWLLLTKRIGNVPTMMVEVARSLFWMDRLDSGDLPENVWIGATVVDQAEADRDVPKLLGVRARVRFLSVEPMLGPISFEGSFADPGRINDGTNALEALSWVICGGESGSEPRPMHPDWPRSLRDQCAAAGVPFLFKQWGEFFPECQDRGPGAKWLMPRTGHAFDDGTLAWRIGKVEAGCMLDGREHKAWPPAA